MPIEVNWFESFERIPAASKKAFYSVVEKHTQGEEYK